jgi:tRNA A58 N-methylase Trm61
MRFEHITEDASITEGEARIIAHACPDGGLVVETGSHKGLGTHRIHEALKGRAQVIGIDNDPEWVEIAKEKIKGDLLARVEQASSTEWIPPRPIDVLVLDCFPRAEAYEHFKSYLSQDAAVFVHDWTLPPVRQSFTEEFADLMTKNGLAVR